MSNTIKSNFQCHMFHQVSPSPWPLYTSLSLLILITVTALSIHNFDNSYYLFYLGLTLIVFFILFWFRNIVAESTDYGNHTEIEGLFFAFAQGSKEGFEPVKSSTGLNSESSTSDAEDFKFLQWFVGFSDAESNFIIIPKYNINGDKVNRFSFAFSIRLHIDDKDVLIYIKNLLSIGYINESEGECKFSITDKEGLKKLLNIFDKYKLNTTKYLDYLDFKKAFFFYSSREGQLTEELKETIIELKNGMNSKRNTFNMPLDHIQITTYWLLGLVEGEGSFHVWRSDLIPVFAIVLTEQQLPVLEKIKEFLIDSLGFDPDSTWKLNNSPAMGLNTQKARKNSKGSVIFIIKNMRILQNYLIPFFEKTEFLSQKGKDFKDFKIICRAVYYGAHKNELIKSLILKLSQGMNNFRLSNYSGSVPPKFLTKKEREILCNAPPLLEHLADGRLRDITSKKIIYQHGSCIYKIIKPSGESLMLETLSESAKVVGVSVLTLSKHLDRVEFPDNGEFTVSLKNCQIKRIRVFYR